jgi:hypothetical protein
LPPYRDSRQAEVCGIDFLPVTLRSGNGIDKLIQRSRRDPELGLKIAARTEMADSGIIGTEIILPL